WDHAEQALTLYSGPFLDGEFDLPEFLSAREKLHGVFLRNIEQLGEFFRQNRQLPKAIALYQRGLEIDELAEEIYPKLMLVFQQLGRYAEGVSVYQRLQKVLKASVGIEPSQETEAIYRALTSPDVKQPQPVSAASLMPDGLSPELPDQPSIAVLPFTNLSNDPEQEYFSDGLTEDIITDLSHLPGLFVIARSSSFTYKGKSVTTKQVGEEMGVRYVLEGSVRKSSDQVRVTAQLIEAASGHHLWAKKYDRALKDVFALQDELTKEIVTALDVELVLGERGRHQRSRFTNPEAGEALYRGMAHFHEFNEPSHAQARKYFEQFTQLEPESILGYVWQAQLCQREVFLNWSEDRDLSIKNMGELVEKALKIDDRDPLALGYAGMHQLFLGNHDQCIAYGKRSVSEGPGMDFPYNMLGWFQIFNETPLEGIENLKRGLRLGPTVIAPRFAVLGTAYRNAGQLELAVSTLETTVKRFPAFNSGRVALASCYFLMGKDEEAKQEVAEILRRDPTYTIVRYTSPNLYRNKETMEKWAESLRKAGLPE
ncbi:MAG: tetratricopeptide repeat protein, partial [SAR324 cluster bacterium]|nr:tetratricopeptide repeat protein [SAR324 cluster bacterium]